MLIPSRRIFYATEAVLYIAKSKVMLKSDVIGAALGIPQRYLEPSLQKLVKMGILKGKRGAYGGYSLGREAKDITFADIAAILDTKSMLITGRTPIGKSMLNGVSKACFSGHMRYLETITVESLL